MPWIFLTLMLANVVYFGWGFVQAGQAPARPVATKVPQEGARILLLSERKTAPAVAAAGAAELEVEAVASKGAMTPVPVVLGAPQCYFVGPFATSMGLMQFAERMKEGHFSIRVDARKAAARDYWVYIPAFTNRAKAEERLQELRSKGIESFIVSDGRYVNAISLGHFSRKELAQSFRDKMAAAGLVVEHREVVEERESKWVFLSPARAKTSLRKAIDDELLRDSTLRREAAACEE